MLKDVAIVALMFALGGGFAVGQTVPQEQARPSVPPAALGPAPAPLPEPGAQAIQDYARRAAELAIQIGAIPPPIITQATSAYDRGTALLDLGRYDEAIAVFDGVIKAGGSKAEGAHYWKAYAQNRLGQWSEALATLDAMLKAYANGRWAGDARALQVEVKRASGQPVSPDQTTDDEIKLIALNSIVRTQPDQVVAIIEKMLAGAASPRVKERALLVLSQAPTPRAKEMLIEIANGKGNPDLQMKAIDYFGNFASSDPTTIKQLVQIYRAVSDVDVKKRVIRSLATQGRFSMAMQFYLQEADFAVPGRVGPNPIVVPDVPPGVSADVPPSVSADAARVRARDATEREARRDALTDQRAKAREGLAADARAALWQIYQSESSVELKREVLRTSFLVGEPVKLIEIVRAEKDPELRRAGVRSLGLVKDQRATDALLAVYREDKNPDVRRSVIDALAIQQSAAVLIQLARQETDPGMKRRLVERLSTMKNKEATDYMMEILRK